VVEAGAFCGGEIGLAVGGGEFVGGACFATDGRGGGAAAALR
jgi:hypothetical protein